MDINKIHDAMKVLKDECNKYSSCKDCIFHVPSNDIECHLLKEPASWEEDKIVENNCTTAHRDDIDEWYTSVIRCDNCDEVFMLSGLIEEDYVIGKFCPHCGKKIVNYKEKEENE